MTLSRISLVKRGAVCRGKDAGFFELAIELANRSPSDPQTLIRAARDYTVTRPEFALTAGMTALRGIANGWGYDIHSIDVLDAYRPCWLRQALRASMRLW